MITNIQKDSIRQNNNIVLDIESTASLLKISTATVRNWVKSGYLKTFKNSKGYLFDRKNIEYVKSRVLNGDTNKLNNRANKIKAIRNFSPTEYSQDKNNLNYIIPIINFIKTHNVDLHLAFFLLTLNLLKKEKLLFDKLDIKDLIQVENLEILNVQIKKEIKNWYIEIKNQKIKESLSFLLDCIIPKQRDTLGLIYQSVLIEGEKNQNGSYYTPSDLVNKMVGEYIKKDSLVMDPCCGTGQFLLAFSDIIENPSNIYGVDIDDIAVKIARINILIEFKNKNFVPNIICKNILFDKFDKEIKSFDFIATNPPWGFHFSNEDTKKLKKTYPRILSLESFSYFLNKSLDLLDDNGFISFILPESILTVKVHKDIREIILKNSQIKSITYLNRIFKNVFTPVIRLDLKKCIDKDNQILIYKEDMSYKIKQERLLNNNDFVFDIHTNESDSNIINKIYNTKHITLKDKADWALGVVTGNNNRHIRNKFEKGFEPIYKGRDINRFVLNEPSTFISFAPEKFQQVAPIEKYRCEEKLIYRFISRYFIFAYDNKQRLTLNSANIVIPKIPNYPIKVIMALFNSSLYQFIFSKKFSSIKILKNHIEQMPLPIWDGKIFDYIVRKVDSLLDRRGNYDELDNYILQKFNLSETEISYLKDINK